MNDHIYLHPTYGVNPTLTTCYFCGEDNAIMLLGNESKKITGHEKAPMHIGVINYEPCSKCEEYMKQGIIVISVRDGETGDNPHRTGGFAVVKEDFIKKTVTIDKLRDIILKRRVTFMDTTTWNALGFPEIKEC